MKVAIEPLEAIVEIWCYSDEQQLDIELVEIEGPGQASQAEVEAFSLCERGLVFQAFDLGRRIGVGRKRLLRSRQQVLDLRRRDVQASKPIERVRIACPPPVDRRFDPPGNQLEPAQKICQRGRLARAGGCGRRPGHRLTVPRSRSTRPGLSAVPDTRCSSGMAGATAAGL